MKDSEEYRLNLYSLDMQRFLLLISISAMIFFTYGIGVYLGFLTNGIDLKNENNFRLFIAVTLFIIGYAFLIFLRGYKRIKRISNAIRKDLNHSLLKE